MNFFELAGNRYSQRGYQSREVEQDKIDYILQCARLAPSATNKQPWKIYLIKDTQTKEALVKAYNKSWMMEAPLIAVFTGIQSENWLRKDGLDYLMCDVTIIADYFILAATEVGLGTCYVAAFDEQIVKQALHLPEKEKPFLLTPLGYAREGVTRERKRKDLKDFVFSI
jgi:nitroreductase